MRVMRLAVLAACSGVPLTSVCQNPTVATVVKGEDLSNVPTAYQGQVKPGALLIVKGRHGSANFEPASAMAVGYAPQSTPVTLPDTDVTKIANGEIGLSLFGFQPGGKLAKSSTVKYDQANLTGTLISGDQMLALLQTDPMTKQHVDQWLLKGYHVYIIEGVFTAIELNASASNGKAIKLTSGQAISACSPTDAGGATSTSIPTTVPGGAATLCQGVNGKAKFKTSSPTAIGLKLNEIHSFADSNDPAKSHYDYESVQHIFGS